MENEDYEKHQDSEELRRFEEMMRHWGMEPPKDIPPTEKAFSGPEKWPTDLNQLLANWCSERFANPLDAVEALRQGENQEEASASLFWYCYSSLDEFSEQMQSLIYRYHYLKQIDKTVFLREMTNIGTFKSQLVEIVEKFTLDNIKYPTRREPYVEVLSGAALIILLEQTKKWYRSTQELINRMYSTIEDIPVGQPGYELEIGMAPLETKKIGDNEYRLSGYVVEFLAMLACVTIWDSYDNLAEKQKDYRASFVTRVKILDFCQTTLRDSLVEIDEAVLYDVSFRLSYSRASSSDMNYLKRTIDLWEKVKESLRKKEDWEEMGSYLNTLKNLVKVTLPTKSETSGGVVIEISDIEVSEIANYIDGEICICEFASKPGELTYDNIETLQNRMLERMVTKSFFPKGLHRFLEKGTSKLVFSAEAAWLNREFDHMANEMRKALEVEIIATLPFLEFLKEKDKKDNRLLATLIADAIMNNEAGVNTSIDSFSNKDKPTQILLKKTLPGFIKKLVRVRNYYDKDKHIVGKSREDPKKMRDNAEEVCKIFFGIDCKGVFPSLIRIKRDIHGKGDQGV